VVFDGSLCIKSITVCRRCLLLALLETYMTGVLCSAVLGCSMVYGRHKKFICLLADPARDFYDSCAVVLGCPIVGGSKEPICYSTVYNAMHS